MNPSPAAIDVEADIDAWLPQTQCTQCGYPRCLAYAKAIVRGDADINQCPPGGDTTINGLATLLKRTPKPLNTQFGHIKPRQLAKIRESECIGCTLCIQACPVDAIIGAAKVMHAVIGDMCTGCELCLPPCPMDCIELYPAPTDVTSMASRWHDYPDGLVSRSRQQTQKRIVRLRAIDAKRAERKLKQKIKTSDAPSKLKIDINNAVARVRAKRAENATVSAPSINE